MSRKIKTSCSRRPFYHQQQQPSPSSNPFTQSNIIRPPTSHPYSNLYHYRSSTRIKNQYESNYFTTKFSHLERRAEEDNGNANRTAGERDHNSSGMKNNSNNINNAKGTIKSKLPNNFFTSSSNNNPLTDQLQDLPKGFKILITQVRVLLKNALTQQQQIKQVTKGFCRRVRDMVRENEELKARVEGYGKEVAELKGTVERLVGRLKEVGEGQGDRGAGRGNNGSSGYGNINSSGCGGNNGSSSSNNYSNNNNINFNGNTLVIGTTTITHKDLAQLLHSTNPTTTAKKPPTQFSLMLQNLHLTQLNSSYLQKITELQSLLGQQKPQTLNQPRDNSDASTDLLRFHNRINYLEMKIANGESVQGQLAGKNEALMTRVEALLEQVDSMEDEVKRTREQRNQWRERALMQKEDSQTNIARQNFLLFSIKKLRQVNKSLTDKLLNITTQDGAKKLKQLQPNPYFQYQVDFFKSLKTVYFDAKLKEYKVSLQSKKDSFEIQPMGLEQEYLEYRKHQEVNLVLMNYYRPTFFSFIEECVTNDIYTCRVKGSTSVSRIFIQVLRAILNCKINEFFLVSCQEKFTRFPEFVYSWFEKFYFNSEKNEICALEPYMQKPISQDVFYRDLMNVKLDQSWEIITFREFLLEQLNLEELYFYLMCQNLLYKKAGINEEVQFLGEFCIFVEFSAAKSVLDLVLSDFESWNISFLTSKLREKIVIKKNIEFIESGFFLRCLIEYYKIERINRFKYIAKLCDEFKSCQQNGLRFSSFISVINRFTEISSQEKVRIYRNCYSVGKGKITADVIFTVCTEELVFLRYLKLKCFYKLPALVSYKQLRKNKKKSQHPLEEEEKLQHQKRQLICVQPSDPYIYEIFIGLNRLLTNQKSFTKRIQKLGVSEIMQHFQTIRKLFGDRPTSTTDSSLLRCKHFIHYISSTMSKIRQLSFQNFYDLLQQNNKKRTDNNFYIQISQTQLCQIFVEEFKVTFEVFDKVNSYRLWKEKVYEFRVNNAARKIQRQVRKKFIEPFMQLYKIIYSELKREDAGKGGGDKGKGGEDAHGNGNGNGGGQYSGGGNNNIVGKKKS